MLYPDIYFENAKQFKLLAVEFKNNVQLMIEKNDHPRPGSFEIL